MDGENAACQMGMKFQSVTLTLMRRNRGCLVWENHTLSCKLVKRLCWRMEDLLDHLHTRVKSQRDLGLHVVHYLSRHLGRCQCTHSRTLLHFTCEREEATLHCQSQLVDMIGIDGHLATGVMAVFRSVYNCPIMKY